MEKSTLQTKELSTGFTLSGGKHKTLHKALNIELQQGQLICVLGPNGSGKSTLLRTLTGLLKPLSGEVFINKRAIKEIALRKMAKLISVVLTDKVDDFYMTAFEIALTGRFPYGSFSGRVKNEDRKMIENVFSQLGISEFLHAVFYKLSDGEKQKVMIARAIVQDTPFIFMDEPVAFVDSPAKVSIMHLVKNLTKEYNKGVLMATHDIDAAMEYADAIWLLGQNGQFEKGQAQNLINSGSFNRFFDQENVTFNKQTKRFSWKG